MLYIYTEIKRKRLDKRINGVKVKVKVCIKLFIDSEIFFFFDFLSICFQINIYTKLFESDILYPQSGKGGKKLSTFYVFG